MQINAVCFITSEKKQTQILLRVEISMNEILIYLYAHANRKLYFVCYLCEIKKEKKEKKVKKKNITIKMMQTKKKRKIKN